MVTCEMCGEETQSLVSAVVAGSSMKVCRKCSNLGKTNQSNSQLSKTKIKRRSVEVEFEVVEDYLSQINRALAKRNIDVHHLARAVNIKESTLSKFMTAKFKPEINIARKIEDFLGLDLVCEIDDDTKKSESMILDEMNKEDEKPQNLADMILEKIKQEKNK